MIGFPFFFFSGGVYYGALPYFFVFAILFTIFMLEGRIAILVSALELVLYISICIYARLFVSVKPEYLDEGSLFFESVFGFSVVSIALGICLFLHFRLYNEQQRELKSAQEDAVQCSASDLLRSLGGYRSALNEIAGIYDKTEQNVRETSKTLKFDKAMR